MHPSAATWWAWRPPRGVTSGAIRRLSRGRKRRLSQYCLTIRRWYTWHAIVTGSKRNFLLRRLREAGDLSALDLALALREPLAAEPHDLPDLAPHLLDTLRAQYPERHRFRTTLDARLQVQASHRVREHSATLARQNVYNAAAILIDNRSFEVLAYVGNSGDGDSPAISRGYAVDIIHRPRSTGICLTEPWNRSPVGSRRI